MLSALGIKKKSPHSTRHTYASMAVEAGIKPEILQKILGHADYSTTSNVYVHADVDALVAAAEALNEEKPEEENSAVTNTLLTNQKNAKKKKPSNRCGSRVSSGDPSATRTRDTLLKRQVLCRLS